MTGDRGLAIRQMFHLSGHDNRRHTSDDREGGHMTHALYELLRDLDDRGLFYTLGRHRPDTILISITVPGERIEIDVFDDGHMEMSRFAGDESVIDDQHLISRAIGEASE
ncbi:hypothetical protein [Burkholderia sp. PU8-34]